MSQPSLVKFVSELTPQEVKAVTEVQANLSQNPQLKKFGTHDWTKLAWCRSLDSTKAGEVLHSHQEWIEKFKLNEIRLSTIRENFKAGFSVIAGRDYDGRPMLWQRMKYMTPATIPLNVGIKSTWLALDAALADLESNRVGLCLIYDFSDVGLSNISLNLFDVRDGSLACGAGHPSHVSRVIFINAPFVFKLGYNAARPLLPTAITSIVTMISIDEENVDSWYEGLCPKTQLPEYLGGEQGGDYFKWLSTRLDGSNLLYHPGNIGPSASDASTAS